MGNIMYFHRVKKILKNATKKKYHTDGTTYLVHDLYFIDTDGNETEITLFLDYLVDEEQ